MEGIEMFRKMRDICDDIIKAHDKQDEKEMEAAIGRFIYLMMTIQAEQMK